MGAGQEHKKQPSALLTAWGMVVRAKHTAAAAGDAGGQAGYHGNSRCSRRAGETGANGSTAAQDWIIHTGRDSPGLGPAVSKSARRTSLSLAHPSCASV